MPPRRAACPRPSAAEGASFVDHDSDGRRQLARMRHRKLDSPRADALRPGRGPALEKHTRLRTTPDLDLLPGEVDARTERLPDRLLCGEPAGVMLRRVRLRVAVLALGVGEAARLEVVSVARQSAPDPFDLDQIDADAHAVSGCARASRAVARSTTRFRR